MLVPVEYRVEQKRLNVPTNITIITHSAVSECVFRRKWDTLALNLPPVVKEVLACTFSSTIYIIKLGPLTSTDTFCIICTCVLVGINKDLY